MKYLIFCYFLIVFSNIYQTVILFYPSIIVYNFWLLLLKITRCMNDKDTALKNVVYTLENANILSILLLNRQCSLDTDGWTNVNIVKTRYNTKVNIFVYHICRIILLLFFNFFNRFYVSFHLLEQYTSANNIERITTQNEEKVASHFCTRNEKTFELKRIIYKI